MFPSYVNVETLNQLLVRHCSNSCWDVRDSTLFFLQHLITTLDGEFYIYFHAFHDCSLLYKMRYLYSYFLYYIFNTNYTEFHLLFIYLIVSFQPNVLCSYWRLTYRFYYGN